MATLRAPRASLIPASVVAVAMLAAYFCFFGPRVPVANGLGWDGQEYAVMSRDVIGAIQSGTLSAYRLLRVFPSIVVNLIDLAVGIHQPTEGQLVFVYAIVNLALITMASVIWLRIARRSNIDSVSVWAGFILLFLNFAYTRFPFFSPLTTDNFAVFLSMLSLMLYLERRILLLFVATVAAVFTWPIAILVNGPMLLTMCRRPDAIKDHDGAAGSRVLAALAFALIVGLAVIYVYVSPIAAPYGSADVFYPLAPISICISAAYAAWVAQSISLRTLAMVLRVRIAGVVLFVIVVCIYLAAQSYFKSLSGQTDPISSGSLLRGIVTTSVTRPGQFIVSHVVFYGIWPILFVAYLREIFTSVKEYPAIYWTIAVASGFFLLSESRMSAYFLPMIIFALARVLSARGALQSRRAAIAFFSLAVFASRFWLPMGAGDYKVLLDFPAQLLFMHIGPWMGNAGYLMGLVQTIISAALVAVVFAPRASWRLTPEVSRR